ncbi:oxidoreductase [Streptomyces netropsis]|uniref:2,4-dienoyl-CoA reductase-like NADH-dependent reductase (Old Yellow Enzyme family) n=1 Tax=Streptomyces netropsis TaxID=55404 RepID=A0A7W7LIX4_STRNE|nr:tRNA-dihydrouridine synthase [Streptomyces netropsis]MBB4890431.1 2,4-dienoyl-CoA reductase-like NADH-dependent reductase (Old Yellow Enzyme family) [Streptomyces netropsis]GGR45961.1 oxidoreductase [Streptomyces netropsis]
MIMHPLSTPLRLREVELRNRIGLPAMSTYQAAAGNLPDPRWHLPHYLTRSIGMGLVIVEATAVAPEGLATPHDLGLWDDEQTKALAALADVIADQGAVPGLQLSHAGRKASRSRPFGPGGDAPLAEADGGWQPLGPSPLPFADGYRAPTSMTPAQLKEAVRQFAAAAARAATAGFRLLELHAGHGRLLHSFLSPIANQHSDAYGGDFTGRTRLLRQVVRAVRTTWPAELPLVVRLSVRDFLPGGWSLEDTIRLVPLLADDGADLIDCTSGGIARPETRPTGPAWQAPYAHAVRRDSGVPTAAVGKITTLEQAEQLLAEGACDLVLMGRALLVDPMLPARHDHSLAPAPYQRALATTTVGPDDGHLPPEL